MTLGKALYAGFTMGGMRVDVDGRVQRADRSIINGLYASGACAVNIAVDGKSYASGTQLGEGRTSAVGLVGDAASLAV
ncbi:MAG: FAD-binding protein [Marmoricola sp.]